MRESGKARVEGEPGRQERAPRIMHVKREDACVERGGKRTGGER